MGNYCCFNKLNGDNLTWLYSGGFSLKVTKEEKTKPIIL